MHRTKTRKLLTPKPDWLQPLNLWFQPSLLQESHFKISFRIFSPNFLTMRAVPFKYVSSSHALLWVQGSFPFPFIAKCCHLFIAELIRAYVSRVEAIEQPTCDARLPFRIFQVLLSGAECVSFCTFSAHAMIQ